MEVYEKTVTDRVIIPAVREAIIVPFNAPNWLDLRFAAFLSLTDESSDDVITGLAETIVNPSELFPQDRYWIGLKNRSTAMPRTTNTVFMGFSNTSMAGHDQGDSVLSSSDAGVGTTNTNFWRPNNSENNSWSASVWDGLSGRALSQNNLQQHFPQNVAGAGGYSVLLGMRLERPTITSRVITIKIKSTTLSADMLYSSVPEKELLKANLLSWPAGVQVISPGELSRVPDAMYFYWPFLNSRLRIHAHGIRQVK